MAHLYNFSRFAHLLYSSILIFCCCLPLAVQAENPPGGGRNTGNNATPSLSVTATGLFTIAAWNTPPQAINDTVTVSEDVPQTGNVLTNDSDEEGNALTASLVTAPVNGTVVLNADGSFTYTPNANYNGVDSLIYQVCDNGTPSFCDTATVLYNITNVNDSPLAINDAVTVAEDVPQSGNVFTNDSDRDGGDTLTVSLVIAPENGTVVLNANGSFTYTPNAQFSGMDSLTYQLCDNGPPSLCDTATVLFTISAVNDAPQAINDTVTVSEDVPQTGNVLTNDSDPEGNALTASLVTAPVNGTVVLNADGSFTYTPNAEYTGADSLIYQVCDNGTPSLCDTATALFNITDVNDPPQAINDTIAVSENMPQSGNVLTNDTDPEGNALTASLVTAPVNGTVVLNADGSLTYTPNAQFSGRDSLVYQVCDNGTPSLCDTATALFNIADVNQRPLATDDTVTVTEDAPATGNLLLNDSDIDGDSLSTAVITAPVKGTAVLNADGSFTYTPAANYNGTDSLKYRVCDNGTPSLCDTATVRFMIAAVNDKPVATDDALTATGGIAATGNVLANDTDADEDTLTVLILTPPANGTAVLGIDGSLTYTASISYSGLDSMFYTVSDNRTPALYDTGRVLFTVAAGNTKPEAANDTLEVVTGRPVTYDVLGNDHDADDHSLTITTVRQPANGTFTLTPAGALDYTSNTGFTGNDTITYSICDNGTPVLCDTATVIIRVTEPPEKPVAGLAKAAGVPRLETDGSYTIIYTFIVRNMGNTVLSDIRLTDDLQRVFTPPISFRVVGNVTATGGLAPNTAFNGTTDQQLLVAGSSTQAIGKEDTVQLTVNVQPNRTFGTYNNTAELLARGAGTPSDISDQSANGNLPDPDSNGVPDESSPTPAVLNATKLRIPQGFSPNGDGLNDRFVIANAGQDKLQLEVFNRWGNPVFKSADYHHDWDGKNLPDGTYYYVLINLTTGEKYMSYITIMR